MSTSYSDNVGNRLLIDWGISGVLEVLVMEVSPSGVFAKIQGPNHIEWVRYDQHDIVEVLPSAARGANKGKEEKFEDQGEPGPGVP